MTLHRPSNVDDRGAFKGILEALKAIAREIPVIFPVHPRTAKQIEGFGFGDYFTSIGDGRFSGRRGFRISSVEPLGYLDFLCLMSRARLMLTDSGGIQEETSVLGVPCVTLRHNTERPVTLTEGTNILAGTRKSEILRCALLQMRRAGTPRRPRLWDGKAGERIIKILLRHLQA